MATAPTAAASGVAMVHDAQSIRFYLGTELRTLTDIPPATTVLNYLRDREGLCGTKEGCAEGDCGACTVVLVEPDAGGRLRHRAVNSCIQLLPTLDGKQLLSVEHLQDATGQLHPVQQAMAASHGTQCGFCTPGFVMSLYALYRDYQHQNGRIPDRAAINRYLAGNLCRCTGYGPIVEAARNMMQKPERPSAAGLSDGMEEKLHALHRRQGLYYESGLPAHFGGGQAHYFAPRNLSELGHLMQAYPDATLFCGATDVGLWITKQHRLLNPLIYLGHVDALQHLGATDAGIEIGGAVTYKDAFALLSETFADLQPLLLRLGSEQIRAAGSIGGNIANGSPIGDMPPPLMVLGAKVVLFSTRGRRQMPLENFFIRYGQQARRSDECVERIFVPRLPANARFRCYKISKRFDQDISAVLAAFSVHFTADPQCGTAKVSAARVAYGGMAEIPKRATHVEAALMGKIWNQETVAQAMAAFDLDFHPIDDMRASADYRMRVAKNLLRKYFIEITSPDTETRLYQPEAMS